MHGGCGQRVDSVCSGVCVAKDSGQTCKVGKFQGRVLVRLHPAHNIGQLGRLVKDNHVFVQAQVHFRQTSVVRRCTCKGKLAY